MKWFRFYDEVLDDPKVQRLPLPLRWHWLNLLCLANRQDHRGRLPDIETIAYGLRISEKQADAVIKNLKVRELIDEVDGELIMHNWDARQFDSDDAGRAGSYGNHRRWHVARRIADPTCSHCRPDIASDSGSESPVNRVAKQSRIATETEEIQRRGEERRGEAEAEENALQLLPVRPNVFSLFENLCGTVTPILEAELREAEVEYPPGWIETAFQEAARANVRKWNYVKAILERYATEGFQEPEEEIDRTARANEYVEAYNAGGQLRTLP